jgi:hypothetical protein
MTHRSRAILVSLVIVAVLALPTIRPVWAQTLVEQLVDTRVVVALRVNETKLKARVAGPWEISPATSGPSKDANLLITFIDRILVQDAEGKPKGPGIDRLVAFAAPGKNPQTGETGPLVIRVFTANPETLPGFYKNYLHAAIQRDQTAQGASLEAGGGSDTWVLRTSGGEEVALRLSYQRGVPARTQGESKPRAAAEQQVWRIYRFDQGMDVVRSVPAGIDRVQRYELRVGLAEFRDLFDGSEQLVSVAVLPWYLRQTLLP